MSSLQVLFVECGVGNTLSCAIIGHRFSHHNSCRVHCISALWGCRKCPPHLDISLEQQVLVV